MKKNAASIFSFIFLILLVIFLIYWFQKPQRIFISKDNKIGLESQICWFQPEPSWPQSECFYMHVPQDHSNPKSPIIKFPVVIFKSKHSNKPPLLHLGAGGPGAPMLLDNSEMTKLTWEYHDEMTLKQGRDFIVMDPRGTGLAVPLLNCELFIENQKDRFAKHMTLAEEYRSSNQDYKTCIEHYRNESIDLTQYHSLNVIEDIELLRQSLGLKKWSVFGVSYAAIYAQLLAAIHPQGIENIIMDSAAFVHLKEHDNFLQNTLAPFTSMFNYCDVNVKCEEEPENFENDFWALVEQLDKQPITTTIKNPFDEDSDLSMVISGFRLIEALMQGVYSEQIFYDLPMILDESKHGETKTIKTYLEYLAFYYLDKSYGDVSFMSHFCIDTRPFSDYDLIREQVQQLPTEYLREKLTLDLEWLNHCDLIGQIEPDQRMNQELVTSIPTLFLHGEYDPITPLRDVQESARNYSHHRIVSFKSSHDIISSDECGEILAAEFLNNPDIPQEDLKCTSSF